MAKEFAVPTGPTRELETGLVVYPNVPGRRMLKMSQKVAERRQVQACE